MVSLNAAARTFLLMAGMQFVSYVNLTVNYRAIAHKQIPVAMCTDALAGLISFWFVRKIARDDSHPTAALLGVMLGGSLAAGIGIWLTSSWG